MAYSILFKLWAMIPKRLLVILVVLFFAYFKGVSDGRAQIKAQVLKQTIKHYEIGRKVDEEVMRLPDDAVLSELLQHWSK